MSELPLVNTRRNIKTSKLKEIPTCYQIFRDTGIIWTIISRPKRGMSMQQRSKVWIPKSRTPRSGLRSRKAEIFHFSLRLIGKIFGEELLDLFIGAT
jgi:hypothetical protein